MHHASCAAAHMDEVGLAVSDIKADGTMRAVGIGGWNWHGFQRFTLHICGRTAAFILRAIVFKKVTAFKMMMVASDVRIAIFEAALAFFRRHHRTKI